MIHTKTTYNASTYSGKISMRWLKMSYLVNSVMKAYFASMLKNVTESFAVLQVDMQVTSYTRYTACIWYY